MQHFRSVELQPSYNSLLWLDCGAIFGCQNISTKNTCLIKSRAADHMDRCVPVCAPSDCRYRAEPIQSHLKSSAIGALIKADGIDCISSQLIVCRSSTKEKEFNDHPSCSPVSTHKPTKIVKMMEQATLCLVSIAIMVHVRIFITFHKITHDHRSTYSNAYTSLSYKSRPFQATTAS